MKTLYEVLRRPLMTEKAVMLKDGNRQVALEVARWATKNDICMAAKKLFDVDVLAVNTMVYRGKTKRVGRFSGKRNNWKKAVLTVKEGTDVDAFGTLPPVAEQPEANA